MITDKRKITLFEAEAPEILQDLAARARATLEKHGVDGDKARALAVDIAADISDDWKGEQIYIPHNKGFKSRLRNEQIYQEFNGFNQAELARQYGVSVQWIYHIVKEVKAAKKQRGQSNNPAPTED